MDAAIPPDKSCTPQHFPAGFPNNEWTPEQLHSYAQSQHQAIQDDERSLAVKYWRLGLALNLLRKNFNHGQWERLLGELGVEKTKASRARAIAQTFAQERDVAHLTVQQAYNQRERKPRSNSPQKGAADDSPGRLGQFLEFVAKTAEGLMDHAGFAGPAEANALLPAAADAISKLQRIRELLQAQGDTGGLERPQG